MLSLHHEPARARYVSDVAECVAAVRRDGAAPRAEAAYA
jgi:hypothetical protein